MLGEEAEVEERMPGSALLGLRYEPPFPYITDYGPRGHTVLAGDFVSVEDGTGVVHTGAAFGEDDFRLGEENGLTIHNPVRPDGTFDERTGPFAGMYVRAADPKIIEALRDSGRLFSAGEYEHAYPHCWRCGTPLIYYAKTNWYARTTEVKDELLAANETIDWHPEHIKHGRFGNWLENNVDWALSRERYWGTPLPIWRCRRSRPRRLRRLLEEIRERGGTPPDDLHRPYIDEVVLRCEECGGEMRRVPDLIDVWWDSGCMPFAQWHAPFENQDDFERALPGELHLRGARPDARLVLLAARRVALLFGRSSYETCLCLGLILDPDGQKMSKSKGNVVVPWDVIDDARRGRLPLVLLHLEAALGRLPLLARDGRRVGAPVPQAALEHVRFFVLYANLNVREGDGARSTELDRWIRSRLAATAERVTERMEDYDTTFAGRAIAELVDDLSNWYVRLSRRRFWDGDPAAFATLRECLLTTAKLLAPLTPFVADEIYENLDGSEPSVHLCDFPEPASATRSWSGACRWRATPSSWAGRRGRTRKMKLRQPLREAVVVAADREREAIEALRGTARARS